MSVTELRPRRDSDNETCGECDSQWFNLAVVVSGGWLTGHAPDTTCRDCGADGPTVVST